jgi:diguanylate cyclase (GGDEF)-like protein
VISDARSDPESQHDPLVTGSFGLRFFASTPIRTREGQTLGTLSCIDFEPRQITARELRTLEMLAQLVMDRIELLAAAATAQTLSESLRTKLAQDALTGAWHAAALPDLLAQAHARALRDSRAFGVMLLDVDYFKQVTEELGRWIGDQVLCTVVDRLRDTLRGGDVIARVADERFACVLESCSIEAGQLVAERCRAAVASLPVSIDHDGPSLTLVSVSIGLIMVHHNAEVPSSELLGHAEALLEQSHLEGRNRVTVGLLEPV